MNFLQLFSKGLKEGFGSNTIFQNVKRNNFNLTQAFHKFGEEIYLDEWVTGGGQELIKTSEGKAYTRVYAGNCISNEQLEILKLTESDIISFLKEIIMNFSELIRNSDNFEHISESWKYEYKVLFTSEDPFLILGVETIYYKNRPVFIHSFSISDVR